MDTEIPSNSHTVGKAGVTSPEQAGDDGTLAIDRGPSDSGGLDGNCPSCAVARRYSSCSGAVTTTSFASPSSSAGS